MWSGVPTPDAIKQLRLQLDPDDDEAEHQLLVALSNDRAPRLHRALREWLREVFPPDMPESEILDWERRLRSGGATFRDVLERTLVDASDLGVNVAFDQLQNLGMAFDWTLVNTAARDTARLYAGTLIAQITESTRANVAESVARWIENGEPLSALVRDLQNSGFSARRAQLIAATETTHAFAVANEQAYVDSGVVSHVEWRTANDEIVCKVCGALNGRQAVLGQRFDGQYYPPAHPGCRCFVAPVVAP